MSEKNNKTINGQKIFCLACMGLMAVASVVLVIMLFTSGLLNKGIVLSRDQIMQSVWECPFEMESRTIDMHIMSLRQKLGEEGSLIRTVRGVGYRLGDRK